VGLRAAGWRPEERGDRAPLLSVQESARTRSGIQEKTQKGLVLGIGKGTNPEADIEALEKLTTRPAGLPTIAVVPGSKTLIVEGLYWGVREMLRRLTTDKKRMKAAEAYFTNAFA
jgi:hypothetical protein